ncbi:MAG TPA: hypothetical protein VNJ12_08605 [Candidatus Dormibacteraeota bacterium]|nr:hypothetical protein [Candidatus Dormibacteraeota bacterium]
MSKLSELMDYFDSRLGQQMPEKSRDITVDKEKLCDLTTEVWLMPLIVPEVANLNELQDYFHSRLAQDRHERSRDISVDKEKLCVLLVAVKRFMRGIAKPPR